MRDKKIVATVNLNYTQAVLLAEICEKIERGWFVVGGDLLAFEDFISAAGNVREQIVANGFSVPGQNSIKGVVFGDEESQ